MAVWVVIPVKPLQLAKSRLAAVITPEQRQQFAESMLRHVLSIVRDVPAVAGTLVISRDTRALAIARDYRANTVLESGTPELNAALMRATQVIASWQGKGVLILPADLPLITADDVTGVLALGRETRSMVIATDEDEDGTNALLTRPPGLITYAYGTGSFKRHVELARQASAHVAIYRSERLLLDIDTPEDLEKYTQMVAKKAQPPLVPLLPDEAHD